MATESTSLTVREAARRLGVHENTIRRYADRGLIRAVRLPSGVRRIQRDDVERLAGGQGIRAARSLNELAAPEIWASDEAVADFLAMTYGERDRDR